MGDMKKFKGKNPWNVVREGSYGKFVSGKSFPVDYLLTSFRADELEKLTFARDVKPEVIDFDLLIQRDIDEKRIKDKVAPYLSMKDATEAEIRSKVVFFPPLLAAVIPTSNKNMLPYYPDEQALIDNGAVTREWKELFKLTFFKSDKEDAPKVQVGEEKVGIDLAPVRFEAVLAGGAGRGAKLVVIDGQHRLAALREVFDDNEEILKDLIVPVCILISPNSTEEKVEEYKPIKVPTVTEIFRHLFVDVNTTMELVGGHFNILLSDENIGSLACRRFCDDILKDKDLGQKALALIEWNTKNKKDSTIIKRPYSITSIGVVQKALEENLKKNDSLLNYLLNLPEVEEELKPNDADPEEFPSVQWGRFSYTQKKTLEKQVVKYLVPCLKEIFFEITDYKKLYELFTTEIKNLEDVAENSTKEKRASELVLGQLLDYKQIPESKHFALANTFYDSFEDSINDAKESEISAITDKAIFQRGLIDCWLNLMSICSEYAVHPVDVTRAFVYALNSGLEGKTDLFSYENEYMQHSVFNVKKIKTTNDIKNAVSYLMMSILGNESNCKTFVNTLALDKNGEEEARSRIIDEAHKKASLFLAHYLKERKKNFMGSYTVDSSLGKEERETLARAEIKFKEDRKLAQQSKIQKSEIDDTFDKLVEDYVKDDVDLASKKLKKMLNYDIEILLPGAANGADDLEDDA